ncbi:hypothetical protein J633_2649 [Acinetobacter sp. 216872]|nr:hypothetical protein J633_2649 [Acinetobacter sp. 216872]
MREFQPDLRAFFSCPRCSVSLALRAVSTVILVKKERID